MKRIYRIFAMLILLGSIPMVSRAQNANTPYSMYGYGILNDYATATQRQMGGVGIAMRSGRQVNVMNPAAYAATDSLTFLWDMGADVSIIWSKEGSAKERATGGGLDYLTMQFPVGEHFGASAGLLPYSSVGYAFGNKIKHGSSSNQGSGGINEVYLGFAGEFKGFSLGANISYNFGNIVNDVYANPSETGQTLFEHVMQIRDWNLVIGAQYTFKINKTEQLTLGLTYSPKKSLHGKTWCTIQDMNFESQRPDTLGYSRMGGKYYQPNTVGAGVSYTHSKASRFTAEADLVWQDWAKAGYSPLYNEDKEVVFSGMKFNNRLRIGLGAEYVPKLRGSYMQRVAYRLGAYYVKDYLNIGGNSVKEYGVTAGLGLPTPEGKTIINFGLEWKHRAASPQKLISENYLNITLGINFNEVWFWQRKLR